MKKVISMVCALSVMPFVQSVVATEQSHLDFSAINTFVSETKNTIKLPTGTAVAIVKDNDIIYEGYFGYRDIQNKQPVTKDTVFYIASMTKAFFAQMALIKEQEGKLDTNWTLNTLFPDTDFIPALQSDKVTIQDLLGHTHGIDNWPLVQATAYTGFHNPSLVNDIIAESYVNKEGALGQFAYTNVGYNLLSHWMDSNWRSHWQDDLADSLFNPLGMTHTSAYMSDATKSNWQLAKGYSVKSSSPDTPVYLTKVDDSMQSAGGMISTASDIARFLMAQMNLGKLNGKQVLPKTAVKKSHDILASFDFYGMDRQYAYGWFVKERMNTRIYEHRGGYAGASTYMSFMPEHKIGLVVLSNQDKWGGDLAFALEDIAYSIALGKPKTEIDALVKENLEYASNSATKFYANKTESSLPLVTNLSADFLGQFTHPLLGTIKVDKNEEGAVALQWGNLRSQLSRDTEGNQLKVEFVPNNLEDVMFFRTSTGTVHLEYGDYRFTRSLSDDLAYP